MDFLSIQKAMDSKINGLLVTSKMHLTSDEYYLDNANTGFIVKYGHFTTAVKAAAYPRFIIFEVMLFFSFFEGL